MTKIDIKLNIRGSISTESMSFKPKMVNKLIKSTDIYFPENFKLDKSNILKALSKDSSDISVILTNIKMFTTLVNYNTKKHSFKKIAIDGTANKDIIDHNGEFMRKLWFVNNSKITIPDTFRYNNKEITNYNIYVIVSSKIRTIKKTQNKKNISRSNIIDDKYSYVMHVDIMVSKETSVAAKIALTCPDKRNNIDKLFQQLFDTSNNFFDWRENENSNRYLKTPNMLINNVPSSSSYLANSMNLNWGRNIYGGSSRRSRYNRRQTQKRRAHIKYIRERLV